MIWQVYRETGYLDWVGGLPGGAERQQQPESIARPGRPIRTDDGIPGLFRFLTFVSRLRDRGGDLGGGSGTEQRDNAVRIMTHPQKQRARVSRRVFGGHVQNLQPTGFERSVPDA
ncbi:hypothetical protein VQ056_18555 [Paenibacillus sp. JTLBN-2024]